MARNNKKGKNSGNRTGASMSSPSNVLAKNEPPNMTEFELLKNAWNGSEKSFDIESLRKQISEEAERNAETKFEKDHEVLVAESKRLKNENELAQSELDQAKNELASLHEQAKTILANAEDTARLKESDIISEAQEKARKANDEILSEIMSKEKSLNETRLCLEKEKTSLDADRIELDRQNDLNVQRRNILREKAEKYSDSSPEKVQELNLMIASNKEYIDELLKELASLQLQIRQNRLLESRIGDRTAEDLLRENSELQVLNKSLKDKVNEYSLTQLEEMKRALDIEPKLLAQIEHMKRELVSHQNELVRYENAQLEFEAAKAQLELIKSLNTQLKEELYATKRTLDAQTGEICPNLTRIDEQERNNKDISANRQRQTETWTLPKLANHVRDYAASQAVPLYYTHEHIAAFLAGLASSKLSILQGLSGTGKTSLPIVFAKAISAKSEIISVASSWRDRNELLGYYNDFSKKYTAKEFTQALYRANHPNYDDTPYVIVLDEMNLSRVEYYFADFLSALEMPDQEKWLISLVDVSLERLPHGIDTDILEDLKQNSDDFVQRAINKIYSFDGKTNKDSIDQDEQRYVLDYFKRMAKTDANRYRTIIDGPEHLINGNTLRIPANVWFVGTANRDESTHEITDKVYDRAQVINFRQKAAKFSANKKSSVNLSYSTLNRLFESAKSARPFDYETNEIITGIDGLMRKQFGISFGNRIGNQINSFVPVYIAGMSDTGKVSDVLTKEAVDYQIANKVLRKLEHIDMTRVSQFKELKEECELYDLHQCVEIINERIKVEG